MSLFYKIAAGIAFAQLVHAVIAGNHDASRISGLAVVVFLTASEVHEIRRRLK